MKTTISFTLDTERDADILDWIGSMSKGEKSGRIRDALRDYIDPQGDITLRDVWRAVQDLKHYGVVARDSGNANYYDEEPPDIANNLNNLGL